MAKRFNHPNILNLIGISYIKKEGIPLMILPFMHKGDVKSFVKAKRGNTLEVRKFPKVRNYSYHNAIYTISSKISSVRNLVKLILLIFGLCASLMHPI